MEHRKCKRCQGPFLATRSTKLFCAPECQVANNREETKLKRQAASQPLEPRICPDCKSTFRPATSWQYWCTPKCGSRNRQRSYRNLNGPASVERPCRYCEELFASPDGRQYYCGDECSRIAKNLRQVYRLYGVTMKQYREAWLAQEGLCAICHQPERTERNELLAVDHDHVTGRFRGLLCSQCNRAIGLLGDDPVVIGAALEYVKAGHDLLRRLATDAH